MEVTKINRVSSREYKDLLAAQKFLIRTSRKAASSAIDGINSMKSVYAGTDQEFERKNEAAETFTPSKTSIAFSLWDGEISTDEAISQLLKEELSALNIDVNNPEKVYGYRIDETLGKSEIFVSWLKDYGALPLVAFVIIIWAYVFFFSGGDKPSAYDRCLDAGEAYYRDIGSWPSLSDGRNARSKVISVCSGNVRAFN